MTSSGVGWVVLDGSDIDAATVDHDVFDFAGGSADDGDISRHIAAVRSAQAIAAASGLELTAIGVTWTDDAAATAKLVLSSLPALGFDMVVSVRLAETDTSNEAHLTRARDAALAVNSDATTVPVPLPHPRPAAVVPMRKHLWVGQPARAAAVLVAGLTALFVVGPELAGQPESRSTEIRQPPDSSATSLSVHAVPAPAAAPPVADAIQLVVGHPEPAPPRRSAAPVTVEPLDVQEEPVLQVPVVALSTESALLPVPGEVAPQHALAPSLPGAAAVAPGPAPTTPPAALPAPPPADPAQFVFSPLFSALP
jgi:hypothetical protein